MIDFRYHIVSIVAIFFALGAGVILGAGPLKDQVPKTVLDQAQKDRESLQAVRADLIQAKALDKYRDDYVTKVTSGMLDNRLKDRRVVVITMPQSDGGVVDSLTKTVESAGGVVTTRVTLDPKLFDPSQRQLVDQVVTELVSADVSFPKDSTTYERAGLILGRGIAAKEEGRPVDEQATKVISGLTGTKLFGVKPTPKDRGTLVVVVAGKPSTGAPDDAAYTDAVDLAEGLDLSSAGVVVAGTPDTADSGLLKTLRGDSNVSKDVSSVDVADMPSGQATVVFALQEQSEGKAGQYGGVDAKDGVAPASVLAPGR